MRRRPWSSSIASPRCAATSADVIATYTYRKGILETNYSYAAAVGMFNAIISFTLLIIANTISKKMSETKLW